MLETALAAHALGYPIVIIPPGAKGPCGAGWHLERYTEAEIRRRWSNNPDMNLGLVLGPASGLIDLEGDGPDAAADLAGLFAGCEMPETPSWQARRGVHYLFAWDNRLAATGKAVVKWKSVEVRLGTGGKAAQSLLPPSVTDGFTRRWLVPLGPPAKLPDVVIERILAAGKQEKVEVTAVDRSKPGDDFSVRATWQEILVPHGWVSMGDGQWCRPGKSEGLSATTTCTSEAGRELLHVFTTSAPPLEPGNYSKFSAFAVLNHRGDFHLAAADLAAKGYGAQPLFRAIPCAELDSGNYRQEFLVKDTLVAGQPMIVAGPKKCLKTSILIDLAIALATGGSFLGRLPAGRACRVAMMTGESGLSTIQETARRVAKARGRRLASIDNLTWCVSLPKFGKAEHTEALKRFIEGVEVLVIDPAYLCMPAADPGNLFATGELLGAMNELCQSAGVTMILAHHCRKNSKADPYEPPELEEIAWSGFQEYARQWILLGRREKYVPGTGEHRLWVNVGGSAGHSALWAADVSEGVYDPDVPRRWEVSLSSAEDAREETKQQKQDEAKTRILDALRLFPEGETLNVVREAAGVGASKASSAIADLLQSGCVVRCHVKKPNRKTAYDGFVLGERNW